MEQVALFDFDGTVTRKDTFPEFIRFAKGGAAFRRGLLRHAFVLAAFKAGLYPNWKAKERLFAHFFRGMPLNEFDGLCEAFFRERHEALLRASAVRRIREYAAAGVPVLIVSASMENWVAPFGRWLGADKVVATRLETDADGRLTGRFLGANCHGAEKVRRLEAELPGRASRHLTAYGDSRGDREMLEYADEGYYKYFKE